MHLDVCVCVCVCLRVCMTWSSMRKERAVQSAEQRSQEMAVCVRVCARASAYECICMYNIYRIQTHAHTSIIRTHTRLPVCPDGRTVRRTRERTRASAHTQNARTQTHTNTRTHTSSALGRVALFVKVAVVLFHGRQHVPSASKTCVGTL